MLIFVDWFKYFVIMNVRFFALIMRGKWWCIFATIHSPCLLSFPTGLTVPHVHTSLSTVWVACTQGLCSTPPLPPLCYCASCCDVFVHCRRGARQRRGRSSTSNSSKLRQRWDDDVMSSTWNVLPFILSFVAQVLVDTYIMWQHSRLMWSYVNNLRTSFRELVLLSY